jgi:hypothetical protein
MQNFVIVLFFPPFNFQNFNKAIQECRISAQLQEFFSPAARENKCGVFELVWVISLASQTRFLDTALVS